MRTPQLLQLGAADALAVLHLLRRLPLPRQLVLGEQDAGDVVRGVHRCEDAGPNDDAADLLVVGAVGREQRHALRKVSYPRCRLDARRRGGPHSAARVRTRASATYRSVKAGESGWQTTVYDQWSIGRI